MHDLQGDPRKYQTYLATRPKSFEANAVALLIDVLRNSKDQVMKPGFWLHIVHLANADLLQDIKQAQDEGLSWLSMSSSKCCLYPCATMCHAMSYWIGATPYPWSLSCTAKDLLILADALS